MASSELIETQIEIIKPNNDTLSVCCVYRLQIFATAQTLISTEFEKKDISTSTNKLDILIFNS